LLDFRSPRFKIFAKPDHVCHPQKDEVFFEVTGGRALASGPDGTEKEPIVLRGKGVCKAFDASIKCRGT
jgi:hypothetical protein